MSNFKQVWSERINGRWLVVNKCSMGGQSMIPDWYCGYIQILPEDGKLYDLAKSGAEDIFYDVFPSAIGEITFSGGTPVGLPYGSGQFVGFDTNHWFDKEFTLGDVINCLGQMMRELEGYKDAKQY